MHCFNDYGKNKGKDCPNLEVRYYIECREKVPNSRLRRSSIVCEAEPNIPLKSMVIEGKAVTNIPWHNDLADFESERFRNNASSVEKDLKNLIELSDYVTDSTAKVMNFTASTFHRKRREAEIATAIVSFNAEFNVFQNQSIIDIEKSIRKVLETANASDFESFDSFDDLQMSLFDADSKRRTNEFTTMITEPVTTPTVTTDNGINSSTHAVLFLSLSNSMIVNFEGKSRLRGTVISVDALVS